LLHCAIYADDIVLLSASCNVTTLGVNWYQHKLGAKQALHVTHQSRVRGLAASAGVWLLAMETEISAALWALVA